MAATLSSKFLGTSLKVASTRPALPARGQVVTTALFTKKAAAPKKVRFSCSLFSLFPKFPSSRFTVQGAAPFLAQIDYVAFLDTTQALVGKRESGTRGRVPARDPSELMQSGVFSVLPPTTNARERSSLFRGESGASPRSLLASFSLVPLPRARDSKVTTAVRGF